MEKTVAAMLTLDVEDLHKRYGDQEVLKGVSLRARAGDVISLIGASGSGKSTMLRCINLLERPDSGRIAVGDTTIRLGGAPHDAAERKRLRLLRARLAMVFQHFNLWAHMNVLENVTCAPIHVLRKSRHEAYELARYNLRKVGLGPEVEGKYPVQLSGGQQQRVAIARALSVDPDVMLFDEPTSALDPELVGEVLKVMRNLADEGRTMLVVTHEMMFARQVSTQVVYLHEGRIVERGTPETLFGAPRHDSLRRFLRASE